MTPIARTAPDRIEDRSLGGSDREAEARSGGTKFPRVRLGIRLDRQRPGNLSEIGALVRFAKKADLDW